MTTLVWLFWGMSVILSSFITFKITKWWYMRKIKKLQRK